MRAVGLITEYNPFHNGHLHHLEQSKVLADAEVAVAVMSGNFLQRGEAALCDKWRRTEMALAAGVDLVVEIPYLFACNSAPYFARGAVLALEGIGGINALCFGSEAGTLAPLQRCASLLIEMWTKVERGTQRLLRQGMNYPAARAEIMRALLDPEDGEILNSPNNILGIEYLKALTEVGSALTPLTIERRGVGYHDQQGVGSIASATGIRRMLLEGEDVSHFLPVQTTTALLNAANSGETPDPELFLRLLLARILRGAESLSGLYQLENGLENRLFEAALAARTLDELIDGVKARQLTRTRVQRLLCHLLNEVEARPTQALLRQGPLYLHLLGCSPTGERFLAASRKARKLPLISNYSRIHNQLQRFYGNKTKSYQLALEQLRLELLASDNYALLQPGFSARRQRDYYEPVRRVEGLEREV
ncbi:nucleotidyltransferase [Geopsychrobacter electrodiphilus]|uniref:nucleotidyltransferase n=1 Tax=Geopsychrobacter electrodiphilus TaxID=225196 RepID=UPI0003627FC1|nr:nucleotidyltransferase [Geopsychrobacter electrodiphilus]